MIERLRQSTLVRVLLALWILGWLGFAVAFGIWMAAFIGVLLLASVVPPLLSSRSEGGDFRPSPFLERSSRAQRIAAGLAVAAVLTVWRFAEDGWIALAIIAPVELGLAGYLAFVIRKEGWSGRGGPSVR